MVLAAPCASAESNCERGAATFEIAPWLALGAGARREADGHQRALGTIAIDAAATIPILPNLRVGAWSTPGSVNFSSFDLSGGGRIELQTNEYNAQHSSIFGVGGRYSVILDAGLGTRFGPSDNRGGFFFARLAFGFTAPNRLYGPYAFPKGCACDYDQQPPVCRPPFGVVAGVRPFVTFHRAFDASRTELTGGLSFEVVGAGWWLGGG